MPSLCLNLNDSEIDCEHGGCVCVRGDIDARCYQKTNNFDLQDGGWCSEGRRDEYCPPNGNFFFIFKQNTETVLQYYKTKSFF